MIYNISITQIYARAKTSSVHEYSAVASIKLDAHVHIRKTTGDEQRKLIILLIDLFFSTIVGPMCSRHVQIPVP